MKYNCPNCGAVLEYDKHKCPYCGTSYFDMSCIDFEEGTPFYLKFKANVCGLPIYITQLVVPEIEDVTMIQESREVIGIHGIPISETTTNKQLITSIKFNATPMSNGTLMTMEYKN